MFIENVGQFALPGDETEFQADTRFRFRAHGAQGEMFLAPDAIWVTLANPTASAPAIDSRMPIAPRQGLVPEEPLGVNLKLSFVDANPAPKVVGADPLDVTLSYFRGTEEHWRSRVPTYSAVRYIDLYPGIDLRVESDTRQVRIGLDVRDAAQPAMVRLRVEGAQQLRVRENRLILTTEAGEFALPLFGIDAGRVELVPYRTRFGPANLQPDTGPNVRTSRLSGIDGIVAAFRSTYLGGSSYDFGTSVAVDDQGSVYVAGSTYSPNFPATPGPFSAHEGNYDVFVSKLNSTLSMLQYGVILGNWAANIKDYGRGITVNKATGIAYVVGQTQGPGFPITLASAAQYSYNLGQNNYPWGDAFLAQIDATGTSLMYGTFLGGGDAEEANAVTLDPATGKVYVVGATNSNDGGWRFPIRGNAYDPTFNSASMTTCGYYTVSDGFVSVFDPGQNGPSSLLYSTFLGGANCDVIYGVGVDSSGMIAVAGRTTSANFPLQSPVQGSYAGGTDGFVTVLDPAVALQGGLVYSTYFGGSDQDQARGLALDPAGKIYVAGFTRSADMPTTPGAFDVTPSNVGDLFVFKLDRARGAAGLVYSTYLGGNSYDGLLDSALGAAYAGNVIAVDARGFAYIVGYSNSSDYPTTPLAFQQQLAGAWSAQDAVVSVLNAAGTGLAYSTFVGGGYRDFGYAIALSGIDKILITGKTESTDYPVSSGAFQGSLIIGGGDAFITSLSNCSAIGDTDGDALLDSWEICGYKDPQNGGYVDLPAMGASPLHRDVFVEIDYMVRYSGGYTSFQPTSEAIAPIIDAFAQSGQPNPDGTLGITLHVDNGYYSIMNPTTGALWGSLTKANEVAYVSPLIDCGQGAAQLWPVFDDLYKNANLALERRPIFHYAVFVDHIRGCPPPDVLGWARAAQPGVSVVGSDLVVGLGELVPISAEENGYCLMHELGHNFGLTHGGALADGYPPNYLSVVNGGFLTTLGIPYSATPHFPGKLDYSHYRLPDLNENQLDESAGLGNLAAGYGTVYYVTGDVARSTCNMAPGSSTFALALDAQSNVDWNCNGVIDTDMVTANIDGLVYNASVRSRDDWSELVLSGGDVGGPDRNTGTGETTSHASEGDIFPGRPYVGYLLAFDSGREITELPGRMALNTLTLYNKGYLTSTVTLSMVSIHGWFRLPDGEQTVVLPPGATVAIPVQYTVPATTVGAPSEDTAFMYASSHEVPGMRATSQWTVRVGPRIDFDAEMLFGSDRAVVFADRSEGAITSWFWEFGDGSTCTAQNPQHTYSGPGRYVVKLTVAAPYGTSTASRVISVEAK